MKVQFDEPYHGGFTVEADLDVIPAVGDLVDREGAEYTVRRVIWNLDGDEIWVYVGLGY